MKEQKIKSMEERVVEAYADGSQLQFISESFGISLEEIKGILINYKENNRFKKTFTDDFKKMIAERDINGIARSAIASELVITTNTVRKACEKFGQAIKERANSEHEFTRIDGEFELNICPSCKSNRNNLVDENTTFCMDCHSEHEYYDGYVMKVNFEYIEE